ncbi:MAG: hypothetical protein CMJ20_05105 [Phycisphaeraceae bacterium]|nr:hypothetical protein [Phycisphaeraceae bacterium]
MDTIDSDKRLVPRSIASGGSLASSAFSTGFGDFSGLQGNKNRVSVTVALASRCDGRPDYRIYGGGGCFIMAGVRGYLVMGGVGE